MQLEVDPEIVVVESFQEGRTAVGRDRGRRRVGLGLLQVGGRGRRLQMAPSSQDMHVSAVAALAVQQGVA